MTAQAAAVTEQVATRQAYRQELLALVAADPRVICVDTDTGLFTGADAQACGARYLQLGIAEHTAMGVAAALAAAGWRPFVNTMATFAATRALEAVKVNIAYNALPVRIVGTHGGVTAGHLGPTHYALEDLAIMRALPNMTVVVPADASATASLITQTMAIDGPVYVRLGRKPTPVLPDGLEPPRIGAIQPLREGDDIVIVCCGPHPVLASLAAADELGRAGIRAGVLNAHTLKPFDADALLPRAAAAALVVTVEEHRTNGGLGGMVAETLAERMPRRMLRIGLPDVLAPVSGSPDHILELHGLQPREIVARIRDALETVLPIGSPS